MRRRIVKLISRASRQRVCPIGRTEIPPAGPPPPSHEHVSPLDARHLADLMERTDTVETVVARGHCGPEEEPQSIGEAARRFLFGHGPAPAGDVHVTDALIRYRFPAASGFIVLQHVQGASIEKGGVTVTMARAALRFPRVCRPDLLANVINAIIDGSYDPGAAIRPCCRSCALRIPNAGCGADPPLLTNTDCCSNTQHLDWCPAYRPHSRAV